MQRFASGASSYQEQWREEQELLHAPMMAIVVVSCCGVLQATAKAEFAMDSGSNSCRFASFNVLPIAVYNVREVSLDAP